MEKIKTYNLKEYPKFDSAYWGLERNSNSKELYFGLCSHQIDGNGAIFRFDKNTKKIDLVYRNSSKETMPHILISGKIHTPILNLNDDRIIFGTHFAYLNGLPTNNPLYEGGRLVCFNKKSRKVEFEFPIVENNGILTLEVSSDYRSCYLITIPDFRFIHYDLISKTILYEEVVSKHSSVCRSITKDGNGFVYVPYEKSSLLIYNPINRKSLRYNFEEYFKDIKSEDWNTKDRGGVNRIGRDIFRNIVYSKFDNSIYLIHAKDGNLYQYNIDKKEFRKRATIFPSNPTSYYPTLSLTIVGKKIYYFPALGCFDYARSNGITSTSKFFCFDMESGDGYLQDLISEDNKKVYGIGGVASDNSHLYLLGSIEAQFTDNENNKLYRMQDKDFNLALMSIQL